MSKRDVIDVHIGSEESRVDAFSNQPLLDGDRKYSVQCTELVCPLAGHDALPQNSWFTQAGHEFFTLRRRRPAQLFTSDHASLQALNPNGAGRDPVFTDDDVIFRKDKT